MFLERNMVGCDYDYSEFFSKNGEIPCEMYGKKI